ncbi:hypothetical protein L1987_44019 [Smallanthus sonchifolius]|uniref:Uncharacterized protein n=1 Tax=Smallanthus sonchifolius TaxID=185202 RepID=A0ACB9GNY3_9ASTR|nr:hypothetical protein L1987_44019 [Smallanthus sonchifolius]
MLQALLSYDLRSINKIQIQIEEQELVPPVNRLVHDGVITVIHHSVFTVWSRSSLSSRQNLHSSHATFSAKFSTEPSLAGPSPTLISTNASRRSFLGCCRRLSHYVTPRFKSRAVSCYFHGKRNENYKIVESTQKSLQIYLKKQTVAETGD